MAGPLGSTPGIIVGVGVGAAASAALEPAIELPRQTAWTRNPNKVLDPGIMARLAAQGGISLDAARASALREGFSADKLDALVYLSQTVPAVSEALALWRRGFITDDLWLHVLVKAGLDTRYQAGLTALKIGEPLSPADLAYGVVRGLVPDDGILPVAPPTSGTTVPRFPVFPIDPVAEAAKSGMDRDRFSVLVGRSGLSIAPGLAAQAYFRGVINLPDFYLAVAEGDLRNEWRDALLAASRQIPTVHDYVELHLRNYIDQPAMEAGAARHGMSATDVEALFNVTGRPLSFHQTFIGTRRGGTLGGDATGIDAAFIDSLRKSAIRPEYYNLAWAQRYNYPTTFALRGLAQSGAITEAETEQVLLYEGWEPTFAKRVATFWTGSTGTTPSADPWVKRAQTQLWTATHRSYVNGDSTAAQVDAALTALGVTAAAQPAVLALWDAEAALTRKDLAASDIRKEYRGQLITQAQAIARLVQLGYSQTDAAEYLLLQ